MSLIDDSVSSASDIQISYNEKILNKFVAQISWPLKTSWPGLVGDCVERAQAIIEFGTPYYVVIKTYNSLKKYDTACVNDCLRVKLYLDKDNYVAITPKVG